jgi:pescadillo
MLTFLEFHQTFVSFINYRLYTSINLVYPPKLDTAKDEAGAGLSAYEIQSTLKIKPLIESTPKHTLSMKDTTKQLETLPSKLATLAAETATDENASTTTEDQAAVDDENLDTFTSVDPKASTLAQPVSSTLAANNSLFRGLHVYLSRETPVDELIFLLLSFSVSSLSTDPTSGHSPYPETDPRITHQICDRGRLPERIVLGRKYVQPQWIVDSINKGKLLDEGVYAPGAELPPHLSPFVEKTEGRYDPEAPAEIGDEEEEEEEDEVEEVDDDTQHQRLLEAEVAGSKAVEMVLKKKRKQVDEDENGEAKEMAKLMMSNKNRRLLEAMEFGNRKRQNEKERLQNRKRELGKEERKRKKVKLS